jgi:hypothetical protein
MLSSMTQLVLDELSEDERRVRDWRREQFRALGFASAEAAVLADCREVDLGRVRSLAASGCALDLILRIVL